MAEYYLYFDNKFPNFIDLKKMDWNLSFFSDVAIFLKKNLLFNLTKN